DIAVIDYARRTFGKDPELKLSIHTGSDKFSLYPVIRRVAESTGAGFHLKTAGTTWLEEVIGLAAVGGEGLQAAKRIYSAACERFDEMIEPYLQVVAIDRRRLPDPREVDGWDSETFVRTLEHEPSRKEYSIHFRQLVHTAFRVAAEMGPAFAALLKEHRGVIEEHVTDNIFRRHVAPLFLGEVVHPSSHATIERTGNGI
ncbi:MAG: hypothetical protein H6Q28_652, partial [Bacteroidetes bacterium]|nr:hypothetical protein [Bacteroidota bacterium]